MGEALTEIEKLIVQYLYEFGNTRENDLIDYISGQGYSREWVKKSIKKLYDKKIIDKIQHPNRGVYLTLEQNVLPLELEKEWIKAQAFVKAAELQAYGEIDKNKPVKMFPRRSIIEDVEDLIKFKNECLEAVKKLREQGFIGKRKNLNKNS
jgi:DNA-binding MarR family transcriptional regulator